MDFKGMMEEVKGKMENFKDELSNIKVTGIAGAGLVKVEMLGDHYVDSLEIDEKVLKESKAVITELVKGAFNNAVGKVEEETRSRMMAMSKDIKLPDWMKPENNDQDGAPEE